MRRIYTQLTVFAVLGSRCSVRVLVLCSVLGSGFAVRSSVRAEPNEEPSNREANPAPEDEQSSEKPEARTTDSAAQFWCPMHPNVRSSTAGDKCKECGMALVAIPDRSDASYWLDVVAEPAAVPVGKPVRLQITVRDRATNEAVARFDEMHERLLHLFVVSSDLRYFDHVHPTPMSSGSFEIPLTFPQPGAYRLVADLLPTGGTPQTLQHTLLTAGRATPVTRAQPAPDAETLESTAGDVRARLVTSGARAGDDAHLVVELVEEKSGAPVTDVEPYLGAWGHMFLASHDLADVVHSHPLLEETAAGGPTITFQTLFARDGWYRVWTQVQRRGRLLTFEFTVRVAPVL
jgi:hypothetical protein